MVINLANAPTMPYYNNMELSASSSLASSSATVSPDNSTTDSIAINAFAEIPLTALSQSTRRQLSTLLNSRKILRSEEGYERDWRGIAALAQQKHVCDEQMLNGDDPMAKVLQFWCSQNPKTATFFNLERYLGTIDRWDVCDDIYENLVHDAKIYNTKQMQLKTPNDAQDKKYSNDADTDQTDDFGHGSDANILTKDDVLRAQQGLPPQKYDAFVLFADADINYAIEMIAKLEESAEQNFKLCLKDRDLLAGISFTHVALTQLIEERCKHLIVIFTEEFMKSPENKFLVNYTQALQIQNKTRKIIPLIYEDSVALPRTLKIYTHLKYNTSAGSLYNFWGKLASSIRNVNISTDMPPPIYTKKIYASFVATEKSSECDKFKINAAPTPPTEIPSINLNGHCFVPDEDDMPIKQERHKFKKLGPLRHSDKKLALSSKDIAAGLRNAHSTSQLHIGCKDVNASLSDLSTTSGYCEMKKKKKWPGKLFKKVFSRSSSKLHEPA